MELRDHSFHIASQCFETPRACEFVALAGRLLQHFRAEQDDETFST
jgi:hypothetical protein